MAVLYYADFSGLNAEDLLSTYADKSDSERLSKLTRTLAPEAKVRSLLAGYLLRIGLREWLNKKGQTSTEIQADVTAREDVWQPAYRYGENGKPYLADYPDIYFNLSHSKDVVVCVIAGQEIGVDIQRHVKIKENLARRFFTEEESTFLDKLRLEDGSIGKDYEECFFRLWSIKESYIKFTGRGMKQGLDTFTILHTEGRIVEKEENQTVHFQEIYLDNLEEYSCSVCMKTKEEIKVVRVDIAEKERKKDENLSDM